MAKAKKRSKPAAGASTVTPMRIHVPLTKLDVEKRIAYGVLAEEAIDRTGEIMDYGQSKPYFQQWSSDIAKASKGQSVGNLRAMHGKVCAGKLTEIAFNDDARRVEIVAKIVDDNEWRKTLEGCYTGFSVGGDYIDRQPCMLKGGRQVVRYTAGPKEASLADVPAMPGATLSVIKTAGAEPEKVAFQRYAHKIDDVQAQLAKTLDPKRETKLSKDAVSAIECANEAIAALKRLAAETALLDGEPDSFSVEDVMFAVDQVVRVKAQAEQKAVEELTEGGSDTPTDVGDLEEPEAPAPAMPAGDGGGGMPEELQQTAGGRLAKQDEGEDEPDDEESDEEESDNPDDEESSDEEGDDDKPPMENVASGELLKALGAIRQSIDTQVGELTKLVQADGEAVEGLRKTVEGLHETVDGVGDRLQALEDQPKPVGTTLAPVSKTLPGAIGSAAADGSAAVDNLRKAVDALTDKGELAPAAQTELRLALAAAAME